jgi:hypothetical protein
MDRNSILALLRAVAVTTPAEIREVEERKWEQMQDCTKIRQKNQLISDKLFFLYTYDHMNQ